MIEEPPSGTELNLAGYRTILEVAQHSGNHFVGARIQVVEDCLSQLTVNVQTVEEFRHRFGCCKFADRVEACIRAQQFEHLRIVIADSTVVELLSPAFFPVHFSEDHQHRRLEFQNFFFGQFSSAIYLIKYGFDFCIGIIFCIELFNTVVGQTATLFGKEVVTLAKGGNHIIKIGDCHTTHC